jgi:hypothetical protein
VIVRGCGLLEKTVTGKVLSVVWRWRKDLRECSRISITTLTFAEDSQRGGEADDGDGRRLKQGGARVTPERIDPSDVRSMAGSWLSREIL